MAQRPRIEFAEPGQPWGWDGNRFRIPRPPVQVSPPSPYERGMEPLEDPEWNARRRLARRGGPALYDEPWDRFSASQGIEDRRPEARSSVFDPVVGEVVGALHGLGNGVLRNAGLSQAQQFPATTDDPLARAAGYEDIMPGRDLRLDVPASDPWSEIARKLRGRLATALAR